MRWSKKGAAAATRRQGTEISARGTRRRRGGVRMGEREKYNETKVFP